jgi:four helix bundle protein
MPRSFEELEVWQKALALTKTVYKLSGVNAFSRDFSLADQMRRAAVSVLSNIAEGFERGSNTEFIQFLYIAKGSCGEVRAQLYVARELGYIQATEFEQAATLCRDISGQISGFISYLKGSRMKGEKFKTEYKSMREETEEFLKQYNAQNKEFKTQDSKFKKE